jgi:soluble lytic murein transglycosylase-like protein
LVFLALSLSHTPANAGTIVQEMISSSALRHGISSILALKVAKIESGFDCAAEGNAGELGPLQIKPATARLIGYRGAISALRSCGAGLEWGMKHLAMAIRAGGVWKHNQGLWAKVKSAAAAAYERKVLDTKLEEIARPNTINAASLSSTIIARGGHPSP